MDKAVDGGGDNAVVEEQKRGGKKYERNRWKCGRKINDARKIRCTRTRKRRERRWIGEQRRRRKWRLRKSIWKKEEQWNLRRKRKAAERITCPCNKPSNEGC